MKFGTDGVRGVANRDLTPEFAFQLGQAAGRTLANRRVVIGRDTRRSGPMLGAALASGFCSVGVDVVALGVVPTPAVGFLARVEGYGLGCVISASHNPAPDNGIKLLGPDGGKLPDFVEAAIQAGLGKPLDDRPEGPAVGFLESSRASLGRYLDFLCGLVPEGLAGMRLAVDCAHGAAYELGPEVLRRLGADVVVLCDRPDGFNINAHCGATCPETIQRGVVEAGATVGVAFDGDADRAVFSDEHGKLINGDRTMAAWSAYWESQGELSAPVVVGTVMSNGGFERYLVDRGLNLVRAKVGDKYVSQGIREHGAPIGGEQSGHIIFPKNGPTGDGLATMLEFLRVLKRSGMRASEVTSMYESMPQVLVNVEIASREAWAECEPVQQAIAEAERDLGTSGRVNVRASGTQPMIRVMVEAASYEERDRHARAIVEAMKAHLGGRIYSEVDLTHALGD